MPSTAPSAAPDDAPRISGDTSGIAEQSLERRAGDCERRADQRSRQHARSAHLQDHVLDRRRQIGRAAGELGEDEFQQIGQPDRIASDGERQQQPGDEHGERDQQAGGGGAGHVYLSPLAGRGRSSPLARTG